MHPLNIVLTFLLFISTAFGQEDRLWWHNKAIIMVKDQIEKRGIHDERILRVMRKTPRHLFIPKNLKDIAYEDSPLPIGEGQTISQPYIVALMTELLELKGHERVLEIGTGSGYQTAVLSPLCKDIFSIEIIKSLAQNAAKNLQEMNYNNVTVKYGDGYNGWIKYAPFDAIIVTAAPEEIPNILIDQLKVGGRIVLPIGVRDQTLKVIIKNNHDNIVEKNIIPVRFVPMVHSNKINLDSTHYKVIK